MQAKCLSISSVTSTTHATLSMACNSLSFFKEYVYKRPGMQCFNRTCPTYDIYDCTSGDETTKNTVASEVIRICPNQPCNPSVLSPSCIIKAS